MVPYGKQVVAINDIEVTNGETATGNIDTLGFDFATIDVVMTTSDDATNNPSTLKLQECDTTVATSFADISGAVGDTDFDVPAALTEGNYGVKFNVDCRGRKRYLRVVVTPLTTQGIVAIANLFRGDEGAINTTIAGVKALVNL